LVKSLEFWLLSIVEDDPLPDEIKIIVFNIISNGEFLTLSLTGFESLNNMNKVPYNPLEAQFYYDKKYLKLDAKSFIIKFKNAIDECFINKQLFF